MSFSPKLSILPLKALNIKWGGKKRKDFDEYSPYATSIEKSFP